MAPYAPELNTSYKIIDGRMDWPPVWWVYWSKFWIHERVRARERERWTSGHDRVKLSRKWLRTECLIHSFFMYWLIDCSPDMSPQTAVSTFLWTEPKTIHIDNPTKVPMIANAIRHFIEVVIGSILNSSLALCRCLHSLVSVVWKY